MTFLANNILLQNQDHLEHSCTLQNSKIEVNIQLQYQSHVEKANQLTNNQPRLQLVSALLL